MSRKVVLAALAYLIAAAALTTASRVLDSRQKFPIGLTRTFYEGDVDTGLARSRTLTPDIDVQFLEDDPSLPRRFFSVKWEGVWHRDVAQRIDLYAGGDDEVVVKVDDRVVIDRNAPLGRGELMARFVLPEGNHRLEVVYRQLGGDYYLYFGVAAAGGVPGPIDAEALFPRRPPARRLRANHNLLLLRRAALGAWVAPPAFALLLLAAPRAAGGLRALWRRWLSRSRHHWRLMVAPRVVPPKPPPVSRPIAALYLLTSLIFLFAVWQFREPTFGFTRFIAFGEQFQERVLPAVRGVPHHIREQSGYDGQFYAQLALEPTLRNPDLDKALDSFPTRARRILFSWTAFVLGMGRPAWILRAYALQNVGFWLLLGVVLLHWLPAVSVRNWVAWCGCLLGQGAVASVVLALTDLPSVFLIAAGLAAAESGRPLVAACTIGLSGLGRETNVLAAVGINWWRSWTASGRVRTVAAAGLIVAPLGLWLLYMQTILGPDVWPAGGDNLSAPFGGMLAYVQRGIQDLRLNGWNASPVGPGLIALVGLLVQALYLLWRADWHRPWWRAGIAYAALLALLTYPVFEGNPGASVRVLLPMTIAYNVLIPESRWFWPLFVLGNTTLVQGLQALRLWPW